MENNKKVLLRVSNLKQYFPLKKRGMYVKANDGVSIDIYQGEVFGLVGESGCGKSTLGRTILQLYKQTDGRTMYYGRSLLDEAPAYIKKTLTSLDKLRRQHKILQSKFKALEKDYNARDEQGKFKMYEEYNRARKEEHDALLDMAKIIGGFMLAPDFKPIKTAFMDVYRLSVKRRDYGFKHNKIKQKIDEKEFELHKLAEKSAAAKRVREKIAKHQSNLTEIDKITAELCEKTVVAEQKIEEMRHAYEGNAEFAELEKLRDDGIDLARLKNNEMRRLRCDMQLIFQDPYSSLNPRLTVGQIIGEGMLAHKYFKRNDERMQTEVLRVMDSCGLQGYFLHRYPHQFSGGQRQRIGIARALAVRPRFIVCDEAVSALDVSIQSQIINLLQDLRVEQNLTYLFITHDLSVVKYISDRIAVMYLGNVVELAGSQEIFDNPLHPYTEALLAAIPTTDPEDKKELIILEGDIPSPVNPPKGCKFHTRCRYATEICSQISPEWEEAKPGHFVACHHMLPIKN